MTDKSDEDPNGTWVPLDIDLGSITHQGLVRENNEDRYVVMRFVRSLENLSSNVDESLLGKGYSLSGHLMFVADGMGGMAAGEIASSLALSKLIELMVQTSAWIMGIERERDARIVEARMRKRFFQIDETLKEEAIADPELQGMGTTLTVVATLGSDLVLAHVGDSRAYLLRGTTLTQLTTDHTLAQALVDAGIAKQNDPVVRSMRHVLTAAIGSLGDREPQVERFRLRSGDQVLLCTDGLTETVDDQLIVGVLSEARSAESACQSLVDLALAGGGTDNITVVLARFSAPSANGTRVKQD